MVFDKKFSHKLQLQLKVESTISFNMGLAIP